MTTNPSVPVYPEAKENKRQHLEFVQNVISRSNANSFLIKGWAITLVSALFALSADKANISFIYIAGISLPVFWILDGYYLSLERRYRAFYDKIRLLSEDEIDFDMKLTKNTVRKDSWFMCFISKTVWPVYVGIAAIASLIAFLLKTPVC